jgi:hypothetical protein
MHVVTTLARYLDRSVRRDSCRSDVQLLIRVGDVVRLDFGHDRDAAEENVT